MAGDHIDEGEPVLLAGGNPQIPKGDGDEPVRAYIAAMPGWKQDVGQAFDDLVAEEVPDLRRAVRWNSPFYGVSGRGWFANVHCFTSYVKVTFFAGASLDPEPPVAGKDPTARSVHLGEGDEVASAQVRAWVRQAAERDGWDGF
ncbi:MAG: DUF1801 domain-containing protein [Acidimicrobiales bacterium]